MTEAQEFAAEVQNDITNGNVQPDNLLEYVQDLASQYNLAVSDSDDARIVLKAGPVGVTVTIDDQNAPGVTFSAGGSDIKLYMVVTDSGVKVFTGRAEALSVGPIDASITVRANSEKAQIIFSGSALVGGAYTITVQNADSYVEELFEARNIPVTASNLSLFYEVLNDAGGSLTESYMNRVAAAIAVSTDDTTDSAVIAKRRNEYQEVNESGGEYIEYKTTYDNTGRTVMIITVYPTVEDFIKDTNGVTATHISLNAQGGYGNGILNGTSYNWERDGDLLAEWLEQQTGGTCFTGNTQILMFDGTVKPISEIVEGDRVLAFDGNERDVNGVNLVAKRVVATFRKKTEKVLATTGMGVTADCPSSNNMRPLSIFSNGVSGSSVVSV